MKIIITMAGEGSRFKKVGYNIPKHEIITMGKSLFEWSMISLTDFFEDEFVFIVKEGNYSENFIKEACKRIGVGKYIIKCIYENTDGQATTAMFADEFISDSEEVIIFNIDTYVEPYCLKREQIKGQFDGFIPVFKAEGDKWSFVKLDNFGYVAQVAEKERISNLATIGLYYFKTWNIFKCIYINKKEEIKERAKEVYIAPMYQYMLEKNMNIGISEIQNNKVHVLGTPEDLKQFEDKYLIDENI